MMLSVIDTELWLSAVVEIEDTVGAIVSVNSVVVSRLSSSSSRFLKSTLLSLPQEETRNIAWEIHDLAKEKFPVSWPALFYAAIGKSNG